MAYVKTTWENEPSESTPINATNLNKIEEGIYQNSLKADQVGNLSNLETTNKTTIVGAINELKSGEEYSANEINTGKIWIDGKPIYRTTFTITVGTSGGTTDISGYSIETITNIIGTMKIQNQNQFRPIPVYGSSANYNPLEINIGNQISVGSSGGNFSIGTAYITLEYTKTTN